jgi:hypothetical protein
MASNIATGQAIVASLNTACNQLLSALSNGILSGAAYTAGKGLFTDLVMPTVSKVSSALGDISSELSQYNAAAGEAGGEYLNEDKLKEQLNILKKRKKDLENRIEEYERKMMTTPDASLCMMYARFQRQLMEYLRIVKDDIKKIEEKLKKLYAFESAVGSLFGNSLSTLQLAAQSVTILSAITVDSSTGKFKFPKGIDKTWFTELHSSKADKDLLKKLTEPEPKIEIRWTPMNGAGQQFPRVYVNGKLDAEKTKVLGTAMLKMGWENFKKLGPEVLEELVGVNDVKTLLDPDSTLAENGMSIFNLLLTYFPATKAVKLYKGMEAAKLLKTGINTVADLEKVSKAAGLTAKEAKALSQMYKIEGIGLQKVTITNAKDLVKNKALLKSSVNEANFWSGLGRNGDTQAASFTNKNGGTTLEQLLEKNNIEMPDYNPLDSTSVEAWEKASELYAEQASGKVNAIIGENMRPDSIWKTYELPALKRNPNVTEITETNSITGEVKILFKR